MSNGTYFSTVGFSQPAPDPQFVWHEKCGYEAIVDDFPDPADLTGRTRISKNAWVPQATYSGFTYSPKFRLEVQPTTQQAEDNFLMVYRPTSTAVAIGPNSTLIDSKDFYGAIIDGSEVAVFTKGASPVAASGSYTALHSGTAVHVVSGLVPDLSYRVQRGDTDIGEFPAGLEGAISFSADTGGVFNLTALRRPRRR